MQLTINTDMREYRVCQFGSILLLRLCNTLNIRPYTLSHGRRHTLDIDMLHVGSKFEEPSQGGVQIQSVSAQSNRKPIRV